MRALFGRINAAHLIIGAHLVFYPGMTAAGEFENALQRLNDDDPIVQAEAYKKIAAAPPTVVLPDIIAVAKRTGDQKFKRRLIDMIAAFDDARGLEVIKKSPRTRAIL